MPLTGICIKLNVYLQSSITKSCYFDNDYITQVASHLSQSFQIMSPSTIKDKTSKMCKSIPQSFFETLKKIYIVRVSKLPAE